jgi:hypothetical protein
VLVDWLQLTSHLVLLLLCLSGALLRRCCAARVEISVQPIAVDGLRLALFVCLIIRTFQLVFLARIVFFFHNKSTNSTFSHGFSAKRTG